MAVSAFQLFGELKLDRSNFTGGLIKSEKELEGFKNTLNSVEKAASRAFSNIGSMMQSLGKGLSVGLTAPLLAIEGAAVKSAVGFDTLRTQLAAATGSTASASDKFKQLNKLAQENAGVLTAGAVATYAFLKPLGFAEGTINETIKAFGKLKAANPEVDLGRMATNLGQLFDQGFEQQDFKELLGNFPRAGEILKKAFNLKSGSTDRKAIADEMKQLIKDGLTKEDLFAGFAQGINTDSFLAKVADPIAVRFEKMKERIMLALEPLGMLVLQNLERFAPSIIAFVEKVSAAFTALSPTMQMVVTALAAVAIAAGPVLYVLGGIVTALAGFAASAGVIGVVTAVIAGLGIALVPVIAIAGFFYQAWSDNWELVKQTFNVGVITVQGYVNDLLTVLQGLWETHGAAIVEYLTSWWQTLSALFANGMQIASDALKVVLYAIQGDWTNVWSSILELTTTIFTTLTQWLAGAMQTVFNLIMAAGPLIIQAFTWIWGQVLKIVTGAVKLLIDAVVYLPEYLLSLIPKFLATGLQIGSAIMKGIQQGLSNWWNGIGGAGVEAGGSLGPSGGFLDGLLRSFRELTGSAVSGSAGGSLGETFLSPLKSEAMQTTAALDKVKNKIGEVKKAAMPKAAEKAAVTAAKTVYGKAVTTLPGGVLVDVSPLTPGTGSTPYRTASQDSTNEILEGLTKAVQEGKLAIEIIDPNRSTSFGGSSQNVSARYR